MTSAIDGVLPAVNPNDKNGTARFCQIHSKVPLDAVSNKLTKKNVTADLNWSALQVTCPTVAGPHMQSDLLKAPLFRFL